MTREITVLFYLFVCFLTCRSQRISYWSNKDFVIDVPPPKVAALYPRGFIISVKDDGFSLLRYRGNVNKKIMSTYEIGQNADLFEPFALFDGTWYYINRDIKLQVGDTIYFRISVAKKGKGQRESDYEHTVTGFVTEDGNSIGLSGQPNKIPLGSTANSQSPSLPNNCPVSRTMVQGRTSICKDTLIFNEEFDKGSLRELVQWDAEIKFPREPDFPFNVYLPDNTVSFKDGALVITPILTESLHHEGFLQEKLNLNTRCTGKVNTDECNREAFGAHILPPVVTAKFSTKRHFNFMFGRVEVRAKLPSGSWLIPEINLEPTELTYGPDHYESGLIRVAFSRGNPNQAKKLYGGPILCDLEPCRSLFLKEVIGINNWYNDYHNYTMIWKPDGIEMFADGERYGTIKPGEGFHTRMKGIEHAEHWLSGSVMAPLDQMFHLTIGLCVGGINDFADNLPDKPWKNSGSKALLDFWKQKASWHPTWYNSNLKIDYVRVFAL